VSGGSLYERIARPDSRRAPRHRPLAGLRCAYARRRDRRSTPELLRVSINDSKNKHATKHFRATQRPIITSLELGEDWSWCFIDEVMMDLR
jgi:hypothetical protein